MADRTLDLFSRPIRKSVEAPTKRSASGETTELNPDDPLAKKMVGNTILSYHSVDDWIDSKSAPDTFEFDSPSGKFYMTKSKKDHKRLVAAGEVVFSPLEIEKFIHHPDGTLADFVYDAMCADLYAWKRFDPAARIVADKVIKPEVSDE